MKRKKPKFDFHIPSLAKATYDLMEELRQPAKLSQWEMVTIGLHVLAQVIKESQAEPKFKELLLAVKNETDALKPNNGKRGSDHYAEWKRQTKAENGEDWNL